MPKINNQISAKERNEANAQTRLDRKMFVNKGTTRQDEIEYRRRLKKQYLVKGRIVDNATHWDVYRLSGDSTPDLIASGFFWQEEAIAFARDRSLGRMTFKAGCIRGMFRAGRAGIIAPNNEIERPGGSVVRITKTKDGIIIR